MGRKASFSLVFFALAGVLIYYVHPWYVKPSRSQRLPRRLPSAPPPLNLSKRVPVALNRGPDVPDGFRGDVHPVFPRPTELQVAAYWDINRNQGRDGAFFSGVLPEIRDHFLGFEVSVPTHTYSERDFSRLLPAGELDSVGHMWALDLNKVSGFLKQLHPNPSMRLVAKGRRPGPDGGFGILRAVSPGHLDILFRVHAEFDVRPAYVGQGAEAWYSPACFLGRIVIDRKAGTVESFRLALPTDTHYNVHVTIADKGELHGWMHVDRMELVGGSWENAGRIRWAEQIEPSEAFDRLTKVFFKFKEIDWVPFEKVQGIARARKQPILAVVALGALDNQTC